jgi:hypothetical protein
MSALGKRLDACESAERLAQITSGPISVCRLLFAAADFHAPHVRLLRADASRDRLWTEVRYAVVVASRALGVSFPDIGRVINRDHSAVVRAFHKGARLWEDDPAFRARVQRLKELASAAHVAPEVAT